MGDEHVPILAVGENWNVPDRGATAPNEHVPILANGENWNVLCALTAFLAVMWYLFYCAVALRVPILADGENWNAAEMSGLSDVKGVGV
ncbi:hypothetical protein DFH28DRAFT_1140200 [Melampsora americana]|nr:hypothetical protein DFH28DRAFT_1140200 [Melampsora americana]